MGNCYRIGGRGAATAAAIGECSGQLWNPHATKAIYVAEVWAFSTVANPALRLVRSTARGTAGSTQTPDADNADDRSAAPASGAVLDLSNFTVEPTFDGPEIVRFSGHGIGAGAAWIFNPRGFTVPAGTGLCVVTLTAVAHTVDVTFAWAE